MILNSVLLSSEGQLLLRYCRVDDSPKGSNRCENWTHASTLEQIPLSERVAGMTLLREIQAAATDPTVDVSTLLRKAKILAARLKNPEFEAWVDNELNGYEDRKAVPLYRVLYSSPKATLTD